MHVVATAGHVDHGKSTLVRALTGMEPDRWAEERRRGMTIDLGYAWTTLPSGERLGFVDVPGHQRFIANMLAGVGPVPAVLFVVAADEGWRRQSAEHLAAVDALGVRHGLLAVTRSDLLDPELATAEALELLAGSSLGGVEAVAVSGATGAGVDALRAALDRLVARLPAPVTDGRVRLWVDRAFSIRGSGTVVTGTLGAGTLRVGDELEVAPGGERVRIRGLESLKERYESVRAVARVAVNLRGAALADVHRGAALLTPGAWVSAAEVDVRLTADPRRLPRELVLHVGSAGVPVHVRPLGTDTARLTLRTPLPLQTGDRALLRDPGEQRVAAGVLVLDAAPPSLRRRGAAAGRAVVLDSMSEQPDATAEIARRGAASRAELAALGILDAAAPPPAATVAIGQWLVDGHRWAQWQLALAEAVDRHTAEHPLEPGMPLDAARHALGVPDRRVLEALVAATDRIVEEGGRVRRPQAGLVLAPAIQAAVDRLRERLSAEPFAAPEQPDLDALGLASHVLAALARAGYLLRVEPGIFLLPDAEDEAVRRLATLPQPFTASEARQALDTTRRVAIPLLEHLDRRGRTRRVDGTRREVRTPP